MTSPERAVAGMMEATESTDVQVPALEVTPCST